MKIKDVPIGSKVICCGATAEIISHGISGTRVVVLELKKVDFPGFITGFQIWSSNTTVELVTGTPTGFDNGTKSALSTQREGEVPLNLFGGLK